ncbi:MAG TPA: hypothetical protein VHF22_03320, partial [Planctomycetota bacterium]|nr:hypothetical protein [Planctomycetota bacterium]
MTVPARPDRIAGSVGGEARPSQAFLFAGVPAGPARVGAIVREPAYEATWRAGVEIAACARPEAPGAAAAIAATEARDVEATLHGCAAWDAVRARGAAGAGDAVAGHSLGLYAALYASGAIDLAAAL